MDQYKIELTPQAKENLTETIDTLMQAAQEIANSTEQDFEQMKNKKWYKRLWEVITCSKNNQKTTARGVTNLAKLTEIIMKAIVLLANHSEETAKLVSESLNKIDNLESRFDELSVNFRKLALEVKKLKYNYKKSLTLDTLKAEERDIVGSIFSKYAKLCLTKGILPNDASRNLHAFAMEGDIAEEDIDVSTHLDKLSPDVQKLLYRLNQSYYYLITATFDESDYFDDFSVSPKDIKSIRNQIIESVYLSGAENYAKTLVPDDTLHFIDGEGLIFEEENTTVAPVINETPEENDDVSELDDALPIGLFFVEDEEYNNTVTFCGMCDFAVEDGEELYAFIGNNYIGEVCISYIEDENMDIVTETEIGDTYTITANTDNLNVSLDGGELVTLKKKLPKRNDSDTQKVSHGASAGFGNYLSNRFANSSKFIQSSSDKKPDKSNEAPKYAQFYRIGLFNVTDRDGNIVTCPVCCQHQIEVNEVVHVFENISQEYIGDARITKITKDLSKEVTNIKIDEIYFVSIDTSNLLAEMEDDKMYSLQQKNFAEIRHDFLNNIEALRAETNGKKETDFDAKQRVFKNYIYDIVTAPSSSVEIGGHNKKVRKAISSFAYSVDEDDVLGFYDSTIMGSGKTGYIFTTTGIIFKDTGPVKSFDYSEIFDVATTIAKKDCNKTLLVTLDNLNTVEITTVCFNKTPLLEFLEEMRGLC